MSLEKLAQDSYTQGLTETLRNMNVSDQIKVAAYKHALEIDTKDLLAAGGLATAAYGAKKLKDRMDDVKKQNRVNHALLGAGVGGVMGHALSPKPIPAFNIGGVNLDLGAMQRRAGIRNALLGAGVAGLGTYLLDDGSPISGIDY